jgi:hypothetical protein
VLVAKTSEDMPSKHILNMCSAFGWTPEVVRQQDPKLMLEFEVMMAAKAKSEERAMDKLARTMIQGGLGRGR